MEERDINGLQSVEIRKGTDQGPYILSLQMALFSVGAIFCRHATAESVAAELEKLAASLRRRKKNTGQAVSSLPVAVSH